MGDCGINSDEDRILCDLLILWMARAVGVNALPTTISPVSSAQFPLRSPFRKTSRSLTVVTTAADAVIPVLGPLVDFGGLQEAAHLSLDFLP